MFRSITNNTSKNLSAGGTISGDVTITGDLTVQGSGTNTYDEIVQGQFVVQTQVLSSAPTPDGDADDFIIENNASGGMTILTPDASPGRIAFGSPSDAYGAVIMHQQSTGKLSINTEGSSGNISMATASGVEALVIDSSQNVGIGGDAVTKAGTFGDATTLGIVGTDGSGNGPSIQVAVDTTADARPMSLIFFNKNNADSSGATTKHISAIRSFTVTSDSNDGDDSGGDLRFYTKPESGSFDERMRIDENGNVGIGTVSPAELVEAEKNQNAHTVVQVDNNTAGTGASGGFKASADGADLYMRALSSSFTTSGRNVQDSVQLLSVGASGGFVIASNHATADMSFWTNDTQRLAIDGATGTADHKNNYIVNEQGRQNHVANTMSSPYYRFDGVDDYIQILANGTGTFDTQKFSIEALVYMDGTSTFYQIWSYDYTAHSSPYYAQHLRAAVDGSLILAYNNGAGNLSLEVSNVIEMNKWEHIVGTYEKGSQKLYVNGELVGSGTDNVTITYYAQEVWIGKANFAGGEFAGEMQKVRFFNNVLDATEVKELYSGASVPYKYKGANQTNLSTDGDMSNASSWTAGAGWSIGSGVATGSSTNNYLTQAVSLTAGKRYRLSADFTHSSGAVVMYCGASAGDETEGTTVVSSAGNHYVEFLAQSDTDTIVFTGSAFSGTIDNVQLVPIGAVAEYDGSGIASDKWFDKSGNDLHGTVSGASVENAPSGDDGLVYEEGTWSPVICQRDDTDDVLPMHAETAGKYVRIGNTVTVTGQAIGNSSSGDMVSGDTIAIKGLPYPVPNAQGNRSVASVLGLTVNLASGKRIAGYVAQNSSQINLYVNDGTSEGLLLFSEFTNAGHIIFQATYIV